MCKGTVAPFIVILFLWWEMANTKQDLTTQADSWRVKKKIRAYPLKSLFINIVGAVMCCLLNVMKDLVVVECPRSKNITVKRNFISRFV